MKIRLENFQPRLTHPPRILNDGNSRQYSSHAFEGANADCLSFSVINNRVSQQPPAREALRKEGVDFQVGDLLSSSSPVTPVLPDTYKIVPNNTGAAPTTQQKYALAKYIADLLRPNEIDPQTGKHKRGPAVCGCGFAAANTSEVTVHLRDRNKRPRAGVSGVYRCDSAWLCPKCAPRCAFERQERVKSVVDATVKNGGRFAVVVLTVRHNRHQSLAELKEAVSTASTRARSGNVWLKIQNRMSAVGVLAAPEITYNKVFGWHYHQHLGVACLTPDVSAILSGCRDMVAHYIAALEALGYSASWQAQDICVTEDSTTAAEYIGKGVAWEIAGGVGTKSSARVHHSVTPFQIAAAAADGDPEMKTLFLEYANTMPGTRSCIVSATMREALGLEKTDLEKPGPHDMEEHDDVVGTLPASAWNELIKSGIAGRLLGRLELEGVMAWPQIRGWALSEANAAQKKAVSEIPFDGPTTNIVHPPPLDPALSIADRSRRFFGGRKIIEEDLARLTREHEKFFAAPPPSIGAIAAALVRRPERYESLS